MSVNENYYFLSAGYSGDAPAWVRNPFMTKEKVIRWVKRMDPNQYGDIQIFNEETLKTEIYLKDEKSGEFYKTNLREYIFGTQYSANSKFYEESKKYFVNS